MARITIDKKSVDTIVNGELTKVDRQVYKTIGYFPTKADAEIAISRDMDMPLSSDSNITLKNLFEQWKETEAYTQLSKQAQDCYNAGYKYLSRYYNRKFKELKTPQFQAAVNLAREQGKSRSTMEKIKTVCGILSEYAFSQDIVNKVYYKSVRLPATEKKQIDIFTDLEKQILFKNDSDDIVKTILILIYTGMRISELLTLSKWHVDIENWIVTGGVKTDAGKDRIIPIHPKIIEYVDYFYKKSSEYLIEYDIEIGSAHKKTKHWIRKPYGIKYYREDFYYPTLDRLKIRRLSPHKARHTFFTRLSEVSKDRKANALVGGHTDFDFSEKKYVQPDVERMRKAIELM
jgi:integrase